MFGRLTDRQIVFENGKNYEVKTYTRGNMTSTVKDIVTVAQYDEQIAKIQQKAQEDVAVLTALRNACQPEEPAE